ncbi:hypothetical protein GINT2_001054 [Glugoides intestinalis]
MDRIDRYNFTIEYRRGETLVQADVLSRSTQLECSGGDEDLSENEKKILKIHEEFNHRKTIESQVKETGVEIKGSGLKEVLRKCLVCKWKDASRKKQGKHVETMEPGEIVAADVMQVNEREDSSHNILFYKSDRWSSDTP